MIRRDLWKAFATPFLIALALAISYCSSPKAIDWSVNSNSLVTYETELVRTGNPQDRIFLNNPDNIGDSVFFEARGDYVAQIIINHRSEIMAVMSTFVGALEPKTIDEFPRNILQIVNSVGTLVSEIDIGVHRFRFNTDGNKIAFISGPSNPGGEPAFHPMRVGILDIPSDSITWIRDTASAPSYRIGYEIAWPNDGHIYISNYKEILKVNEDDFSITTLDIIGSANISPDGRYLYDLYDPYIGNNMRILEISNEIDVSNSVFALIGDNLDMRKYRIHLNWLGDNGSLLLIGLSPTDIMDGALKSPKWRGKHTFLIDIEARGIVLHRTGEKLKVVSYNLNRASSSPFMVEDESGAVRFDDELMQKLRELKVIE